MNLDLAERVWVRFLDTHSPGPGDRAHCVRDLAAALQPELDALAARVAALESALGKVLARAYVPADCAEAGLRADVHVIVHAYDVAAARAALAGGKEGAA